MNWLITENELDREQRKFLSEFMNRNTNECILGFPGSGKTILLYYAAIAIRKMKPDAKILFVEFTHALINMIEASLKQIHIRDIKVVTQYEFEKMHHAEEYDCIICDEVQDLSPRVLKHIAKQAQRVIVGEDQNQKVYKKDPQWNKRTCTDNDIMQILHPEVTRLNIVHRLGRFVVEAANEVMPEMNILSEGRISMMKKNIKIRLWKANNQQQEVSAVFQEAKETLRMTDSVAILLPSHSKITNFTNKVLSDAGKKEWKWVYDDHGNLDYNKMNNYLESCGIPMHYVGNGYGSFLDDKPMITLMTYHGSKGLDFDKVFLPFCNYYDNNTKKVDNDKQVFLVGMTRSRGDLIISFSKKLNSFVSRFAENCTHKDLSNDGTPTLFDIPIKSVSKNERVKVSELFGW